MNNKQQTSKKFRHSKSHKNIGSRELNWKKKIQSYPYLSRLEDELGFSNWIAPSKGTFSSPTKIISSVTKDGGGELLLWVLEIDYLAIADVMESTLPSALVIVRLRDTSCNY